MNDFDEVIDTNSDVSQTTEPKKTTNIKAYNTLLNRSAQSTKNEIRNQSVFIGEQERLINDKISAQNAITNDTLDNIVRTAVVFPVNTDGTIHFSEIEAPEEMKDPQERERYTREQKRIQDRLKYIMNEYDEARATSADDIKYIAGSAIRSGINLASESVGTVPIIAGMVTQGIGRLGGKDNLLVRNGVLLQEWTLHQLDEINDGLTSALINERKASGIGKEVAKLTDTATQVGAIALSAGVGGAKAGAKVIAKAEARGISKKAAEKVAKKAAQKTAEITGKATSALYASAQMENYLTRPREGMTNEEYLQYLKSKTGGEILGDLAFGALVGISNYYLENAFGAEASVKNFFGSATEGFLNLASRRATEEGITEIAQDEVLDVADLFRGVLGNKTRGITGTEFLENLISPQTLETFVVSSIIGGATAGVEYRTARTNIVKEYKQGLKKVFPNATEQQLETAGKAFIRSTEDSVIRKIHQSLIADDQLRNMYGTYNAIVQNRINELIDQSVAQGKELAFKEKSPEYQAQFVGSVSQRFIDELYSQAIIRGVPVSEVFDVTKMDVENGILYMYGTEYGKRPLTQFTRDMTPAQWERAQREARAADELQKKQKAEKERIKQEMREARKAEKERLAEEKKAISDATSVPYRNYLTTKNVTDVEKLSNSTAMRDARVFARAEIRDMEENTARGILAVIRPDLPVASMSKAEIKQILRSEIDNYIELENRTEIQPVSVAPTMLERQKRIVDGGKKRRIAKPKSFSESVRSAGINKATVEKLGIAGELKQILGNNYRFFVRKNGTISNFEEIANEYKYQDRYDPNAPNPATVNDFLELLEQDLQTKDIYSYQDEAALENWRENSIRAEKERQSIIANQNQEAELFLERNKIDTTGMTQEKIQSEASKLWEQQSIMDTMDSDIDIDQIPDDIFPQSLRETMDLADENARLDDIYPAYTGETINIDGQERSVYNSNGERIAQSEPALRNFYKWFGDSKAVDEQGRPLVVYHITPSTFDTFNLPKLTLGYNTYGSGIYTTTNPKHTSYGDKPDWNLMSLYIKAERPADSDHILTLQEVQSHKDKIVEYGGQELYDRLESVASRYEKRNDKTSFFALDDELKLKLSYVLNSIEREYRSGNDNKNTSPFLDIFPEYDSIVAYLTSDDGDFEYYVAFEPNQIKSVDNRGTFDISDPNIYRQKTIGAWNPLRKTIELGTGANETTIAHELSHFWLDNMMMYSRLASAAQNDGFMRVWKNIKRYLDIDDRQDVVNVVQAEKYTSAYMQYIRNNKTAPLSDLGFKGLDEYIGDISLDYFENAMHREEDGTYSSELEKLTPEIVDALQSLTTTDLSRYHDIIANMQLDEGIIDDITDATLGTEATPQQMRTSGESERQAMQEKQMASTMRAAEADSQPVSIPEPSEEMKVASEANKKSKPTSDIYAIGTTDEESFAKAREIIARDRELAEQTVLENPNGVTDGIANSFISLELAQQAVQQGKNATPYLESFVNGMSGSGANLRTATLLNKPELAWAKDLYEASKAREYALALRMRPSAKNAIMKRSAIVRAMETRLDEYVEKLYPQLLQAQTYEEQVKIINEWGNNTAKELGIIPSTEMWYQSVGGNVGVKKTDFTKAVTYQKRKLKDFLKSKLGETLSDAEQLKIRELHRNAVDAMRELRDNPSDKQTKLNFIRQTRAYQDYLNSLQPANWATALFASIPRASMLFRISTQVKNTIGTRVEIALSDINRALRYGKESLIDSKDISAQIKDSMEMFSVGGFSPDIQESFFEAPTLAWGEKQFNLIARGGERRGAVLSGERLLQDAKDIADYARNQWKSADTTTQKAFAGTRIALGTIERVTGKSFDVLAYSDAFMKADIAVKETAHAATFYATQEGNAKGWTKQQIRERAYELFNDARSYIPKTKLGESIRKRAAEQAKLETFIKSGTFAQMANNVRNALNLGKESGIGTFISPFVSTPANVMQLGVDYGTGWWRRFDGWAEVKKRVQENAAAGKPIDEKDMQFLEKGYRGTYGIIFLGIMLSLFKGAQALTGDDDAFDYVPPYQALTAKEKQYYRAVNGGKYNAIKVGNVWINAEYFGGLSEAITGLGTWYHNNSVISTMTSEIMRTPVIGDLVQQKQDLEKDVLYNKTLLDSAFEGAESQLQKYIPGIIQDINRAREKGALYVAFGGSLGFTTSSDVKEVKDVQMESGASYTPITRGKAFSGIDLDTKREINKEFDELYNAEVSNWIKRHKNAKPEEQKKALNSIRKKITGKLKQKHKIK